MRALRLWILPWIVLALAVLTAPTASATPIAIGIDAFGPGSTLTTFFGLPDGTEVNGLVADGILFQYSWATAK